MYDEVVEKKTRGKEKDKKLEPRQIFLMLLVVFIIVLSGLVLVIRQSEKAYHVNRVMDGETVVLEGGKTVGLLGVRMTEKGGESDLLTKQYLNSILDGRNIWLEYDRKSRDSRGRDLVWVWVGCENTPKFMASELMKMIRNQGESAPEKNPIGCEKGVLVNEQVIKMDLLKAYFANDGWRMKYQQRLEMADSQSSEDESVRK